MQAQMRGLSVEAIKLICIALFQSQGKGTIQRAALQNPVTRQPGKP